MANSNKHEDLVSHFFRNEYGKVVTYLTAKYGTQHLEAIEDAVQDALLKAMQAWRNGKIPDNPGGWIARVSQNRLIDHFRKQQKVYYATQLPVQESEQSIEVSEEVFNDELVKMIFACCNPSMSTEQQIILTLKILGGLSVREIASALLKQEETIAKAYTRAKKKFKKENLKLEIPSPTEVLSRIDPVLKVIYLLFNEGYKCTEGNQLIRKDLCEEAMRLNAILLGNDLTNTDSSRALMALMHFQVSRFQSRVDDYDNLVTLEFQDRGAWDKGHIEQGNRYLSSIEDGLTDAYFIQAAISGIHANASSFAETNWRSILMLYDHLQRLHPNPIISLNRIIPYAKVHGAQAALLELEKLEGEAALSDNYLLPAIEADLHLSLGDLASAREKLHLAVLKTNNNSEKAYLQRKAETIG